MTYLGYYDLSGFGRLVLGSDGRNLVGLWIEDQKYFLGKVKSGEMELKEDLEIFGQVRGWLERYFSGEKPEISELSLVAEGTEFQQGVWGILRQIPYGKLITYGEIASLMAKKMGKPRMSAQAVGGAVGHNPISIIVPCHRVVGSDGSLTGYASGLDVKIRLLLHEGIDVEHLGDFRVDLDAII